MNMYGVNDNYGVRPPTLEVFPIESEGKRQYKLACYGKGSDYRIIVKKDELRLLGYTEEEAWSKYKKELLDKLAHAEKRVASIKMQLDLIP
jgi:hypothetical protein